MNNMRTILRPLRSISLDPFVYRYPRRFFFVVPRTYENVYEKSMTERTNQEAYVRSLCAFARHPGTGETAIPGYVPDDLTRTWDVGCGWSCEKREEIAS